MKTKMNAPASVDVFEASVVTMTAMDTLPQAIGIEPVLLLRPAEAIEIATIPTTKTAVMTAEAIVALTTEAAATRMTRDVRRDAEDATTVPLPRLALDAPPVQRSTTTRTDPSSAASYRPDLASVISASSSRSILARGRFRMCAS